MVASAGPNAPSLINLPAFGSSKKAPILEGVPEPCTFSPWSYVYVPTQVEGVSSQFLSN